MNSIRYCAPISDAAYLVNNCLELLGLCLQLAQALLCALELTDLLTLALQLADVLDQLLLSLRTQTSAAMRMVSIKPGNSHFSRNMPQSLAHWTDVHTSTCACSCYGSTSDTSSHSS